MEVANELLTPSPDISQLHLIEQQKKGACALTLEELPKQGRAGRMSLPMSCIVGLWRLIEWRKPRCFDPNTRRIGLQNDITIVAKKGPRNIQVFDMPSEPFADAELPARRLYLPSAPRTANRLLLYFHGGGYVLGSLDSADSFCRILCEHSGMAVLSLDYRLAPEHPYPAALNDATLCWQWLQSCRDRLTGRPDYSNGRLRLPSKLPLLVGGDSAGAHLATTLCLRLKRENTTLPTAQVLLYPVIDFSAFATASYEQFGKGYILEQKDMEWFRSCYLPDPKLHKDTLVSPLMADDLHGLPPALVVTAEFDVLSDEGKAWVERLCRQGVPAIHYRMSGVVHGFATMTAVGSASYRVLHMVDLFIRKVCGHCS